MNTLERSAALLEERKKSLRQSPELQILSLHQETLEALAAGRPAPKAKAPKAPKKKAAKKAKAAPAAEPQPGT